MKVGALVLAAGLSRRFGSENKLLLPMGEHTMIEKVILALKAAGVAPITVVTGYQSKEISAVLEDLDQIRLVHNPDFVLGMSTSIRRGISECSHLDACLICLGDMPYLTGMQLKMLVDNFPETGSADRILIPTFRGRRGHPVVFGRNFFGDLRSLAISDQGARQIIEENQDRVMEVDLGTENIFLDIDVKTSLNLEKNGD